MDSQTKKHRKFEELVKYAIRDGEFWYARWGIYNIVASKEGTESAVKLKKMSKELGSNNSVRLTKGKGRFIVDEREGMENIWEEEYTEIMIRRKTGNREEVRKILSSTKEERKKGRMNSTK